MTLTYHWGPSSSTRVIVLYICNYISTWDILSTVLYICNYISTWDILSTCQTPWKHTGGNNSLPWGVTEGSTNQEVTLASESWMWDEGVGVPQRMQDIQGSQQPGLWDEEDSWEMQLGTRLAGRWWSPGPSNVYCTQHSKLGPCAPQVQGYWVGAVWWLRAKGSKPSSASYYLGSSHLYSLSFNFPIWKMLLLLVPTSYGNS